LCSKRIYSILSIIPEKRRKRIKIRVINVCLAYRVCVCDVSICSPLNHHYFQKRKKRRRFPYWYSNLKTRKHNEFTNTGYNTTLESKKSRNPVDTQRQHWQARVSTMIYLISVYTYVNTTRPRTDDMCIVWWRRVCWPDDGGGRIGLEKSKTMRTACNGYFIRSVVCRYCRAASDRALHRLCGFQPNPLEMVRTVMNWHTILLTPLFGDTREPAGRAFSSRTSTRAHRVLARWMCPGARPTDSAYARACLYPCIIYKTRHGQVLFGWGILFCFGF